MVAFVACAASLRPAALEYLREYGKTWVIPEPAEPADGAELLTLLVEAVKKPSREIVAFVIPKDGGPVMNTLNLHREKLREGASKLVFIEGAEGMAALRSQGRDAYTFRDLLAYLNGEAPLPPVEVGEESEELIHARERYRRAVREQGAAAWELGEKLRSRRQFVEAERLLRRALEQYDEEGMTHEEDAEHYANLCYGVASTLGHRSSEAQSLQIVRRGLKRIEGHTSEHALAARADLLLIAEGAYGRNRNYIHEAARVPGGDEHVRPNLLFVFGQWHMRTGNHGEAGRTLSRYLAIEEHQFNSALAIVHQAELYTAMGKLSSAEARARVAVEALSRSAASPLYAHGPLGELFFLRGELDSAERILDAATRAAMCDASVTRERIFLAGLSAERGDIESGFSALRDIAQKSIDAGSDGGHYRSVATLVEFLTKAHAACRLSPDDLPRADDDLTLAEDLSRAAFGTDPPWYTIFFPLRRSELLALRPERLPDALALSQLALDRARASCAEIVPEAARIHGQHLILAGRYDEALATLALAESAAREEEYLRELAAAQRLTVVALVLAGHPASEIEARLTALRQTLESTGSPRITAENLLDLARALPPTTTLPEPLALADEALELFTEMPYPAKESLSLETAGDVLLARGDAEGALRRYKPAFQILSRYGLLLRAPLLQGKIDRLGGVAEGVS
ncbi:hypothetical protein [Polyangium fumosum]|uniref:hypothetical protein n=1 Tax=Polyangium fumosum TaxID=889272 RepID=UPI001478E423|nr:hypothetical protein [Polyangium fumosum]